MSAKSLPVAVAQFTVTEEPERNLEIIDGFARDAAAGGAKLLALPEGLIARRGDDDSYAAAHAQPLDGPFVDGLRRISAQRHIVLMGTVHVAPAQAASLRCVRGPRIRRGSPRRCVAAYRRY